MTCGVLGRASRGVGKSGGTAGPLRASCHGQVVGVVGPSDRTTRHCAAPPIYTRAAQPGGSPFRCHMADQQRV